MSARPHIYVTGPDRGAWPAWRFTARAIRRAGGQPHRVRPRQHWPRAPMEGLVLGGGTDVSPTLYEALDPPSPESKPSLRPRDRALAWSVGALRWLFGVAQPNKDPARDELEASLLNEALQADLPVLGICRGMQLLNVVRGGDLVQDVATFYAEHPHIRSVLPRHRINVRGDSRLAEALGRAECKVNALHDQAVRRLGADLEVAATDARGVVQAIEVPARRFVLGVQWHPEYLPQLRPQRRLFGRLVGAARSCRRLSNRST